MRTTGRNLWAVVRSRSLLLLGFVGASMVGAGMYGLLAKDQYRATAVLYIDSSTGEGSGASEFSSRFGKSDLDLLRSDRVAQRVVENEHLVQEPMLRSLYLESIDAGRSPVEVLAQYVAARIGANSGNEGEVVRLSVTMPDPSLAARIANAYAQAWGEVTLELRAAAIRRGVERASQDLTGLRARLGVARARLSDPNALASTGSSADDRFAQMAQLASGNIASGHGITPDASDPSSDWLPAPVQYDQSSSNASVRLERGVTNPSQGVSSAADDDIRLAQLSLEHAEDRLARLSAEGIGMPFPAHLLRPASMPMESTKPSFLKSVSWGVSLGMLLAIFAVAVAEILDRRVRRASDISTGLGVVVLGRLPFAGPLRSLAMANHAVALSSETARRS